MTKQISTTLLILFIIGTAYWYRETWSDFFFPVVPCAKPISYSIGDFDERFGIPREQLIETMQGSEQVWEDAMGKQLFSYSATGTLKVNLMYDYRQQATDKLSDIGSDINEGKESYEQLKSRYESMTRDYNRKKASYEGASLEFDKDKKAYDEDVSYWNERGGAPKDEYEKLQKEGSDLSNRAHELNDQAEELNSLSARINKAANDLNDLAKKLNIKVATFNTIGASTGEEFNEGEYTRDENGVRINIYQFDTLSKLRRLLEHEFGHALGLDHVEDEAAVMYRLNSSENDKLTEADLIELRATCSSK